MNSFYVPQLGSQIYTMGGVTTHLNLLADKAGEYPGFSAMFSGEAGRQYRSTNRNVHPHIKPIGLIARLIAAITESGELVVDPAAGSFAVMRAAHQVGRDFVGCDLAYDSRQLHLHGEMNEYVS